MRLQLFQIDAFSSKVFSGNPAAVCPLESWLPDDVMQAIAAENNLAETAFFVPENGGYKLRWFTPEVEVALCGHATLASAFVISNRLQIGCSEMRFQTKSGQLSVQRAGDMYTLDFPVRDGKPCMSPPDMTEGLKAQPNNVFWCGEDFLVVFGSEQEVRALKPDFEKLKNVRCRGVIATAKGDGDSVDFISRFFAPRFGIPEDPVTGSSHCSLTPYWAGELGKKKMRALQVSKRGGELFCELKENRVLIGGYAAAYLEGHITV